jgi:hypothetical protein
MHLGGGGGLESEFSLGKLFEDGKETFWLKRN